MAEKKYLRLQVGLGVAADEEDIEEQAEEAVDKGQEHDPASSQARSLAQIGLPNQSFRTPHPRSFRAAQPNAGSSVTWTGKGVEAPARRVNVSPGERPGRLTVSRVIMLRRGPAAPLR
jgi:hypothetical protein